MDRHQNSVHRRIGADLALYVRQQGGRWPSVSALQAVVADLVAGQAELLLPVVKVLLHGLLLTANQLRC
jgi:hypothetical protein